MTTAVGATATTGFVATVQAAYNGSKLQAFAKGFFAFIGKIFSTAWAWKLPIAGVVILGAAAYKYRTQIADYLGLKCCGSKQPLQNPPNNNGLTPPLNNDSKDNKQLAST